MPWLFGRGLRERLLQLLNSNGPLQTIQVVRALTRDEKKVYRALKHFLAMGIVTKYGRTGHRFYWTLDQRFAAYRELRSLLNSFARILPPVVLLAPRRRLGSAGRRRRCIGSEIDGLFGSATRTRILLAVVALPNPSLREISGLACVRYESVVYAVNRFESDGILKTTASGRDRRVFLDEHFVLVMSLKCLLKRIASQLSVR
jgi:hypothetical protein